MARAIANRLVLLQEALDIGHARGDHTGNYDRDDEEKAHLLCVRIVEYGTVRVTHV